MALAVILTGIYWCLRKEVGVGWEGSIPAFYIRGRLAIFVGIMAITIGAYFLLTNSTFIQVDACLDAGGRYDYESEACETSQGEIIES